jgi:Glutamyl-tRNAGlu reductase, dimerisation domain
VTQCHGFDIWRIPVNGCAIPYQRFLLNGTQSASIAKLVGVVTGLLPIHQEEIMTNIDKISATLVSLRERFEAVRCGEIERVRVRLGNLSPEQENAIDSLSHALVERVLQAPTAMLESASAGNQAGSVVETVRRIFNLHT